MTTLQYRHDISRPATVKYINAAELHRGLDGEDFLIAASLSHFLLFFVYKMIASTSKRRMYMYKSINNKYMNRLISR